jgi:hypothetical protein
MIELPAVVRPNKILEARKKNRAVPIKPVQPGDTEVISFTNI